VLKFGTGFDWMVVSSSAAAAFAQWGWYGLPAGPLPAAMKIFSPGRFDAGNCLQLANSNVGTEQTQANYLFPNSYEHNVFYMGVAMYVPATAGYTKSFIGVARNGTALLTAALCEFGTIELWMGRESKPLGTLLATSSGGSYFNDTWNYIELGGLLIDTTAGWATVRVNTVPVIEVVSTVTQPDNLQYNSIQLGYMVNRDTSESTGETQFDDMYLVDDQGDENNSWLGNIRVQAQLPAGPGDSTTWDPYPSVPNWQRATNTAVDDSSYVYSNDAADLDLYTITPLLNAPQVFGVVVRGAYRQTDATQRSVWNVIKSGATLQEGVEFFTPGSYAFSSDIFEQDPDTELPWEYQAVNLLQIGPQIGGFDLLDVGDFDHLDLGDGSRLQVS
jgi:hypothetical protein